MGAGWQLPPLHQYSLQLVNPLSVQYLHTSNPVDTVSQPLRYKPAVGSLSFATALVLVLVLVLIPLVTLLYPRLNWAYALLPKRKAANKIAAERRLMKVFMLDEIWVCERKSFEENFWKEKLLVVDDELVMVVICFLFVSKLNNRCVLWLMMQRYSRRTR